MNSILAAALEVTHMCQSPFPVIITSRTRSFTPFGFGVCQNSNYEFSSYLTEKTQRLYDKEQSVIGV
jgi:hypothetical protein